MSRGVSTVVDVTVFLLFVSAAASVIVSESPAGAPREVESVEQDATVLQTTTTSVEYRLNISGTAPEWVANGTARRRRTAHGTLAELLGAAAMGSLRIDGRPVVKTESAFERAVSAAVRARLTAPANASERAPADGTGDGAPVARRVAVTAEWAPYESAPIDAHVGFGDTPPPSTDVRATVVTVSSGMENVSLAARSAAQAGGFSGLAAVIAQAIVTSRFPRDEMRVALRGGYPASTAATDRYSRFGSLVGVDRLAVGEAPPARLNRRLTAALAGRLADDMRDRFVSPTAASAAIRLDQVRITVRAWSP